MQKTKLFISFLLICTVLFGEESSVKKLKKAAVESVKYFNANSISSPICNNALFARHPITGNADFRMNGQQLIYTSGLWIGAKVNGETIASIADFSTDYFGGAIDKDGSLFGKNDSTFRVYKISKGDNIANSADYANWPYWQGAPVDENGNPLLIGDQTLWCCFTDAFEEKRIRNEACSPLGAEIHLTVWGYEEIENVMFLRWEIINKSEELWEETYFGIYADPDVGDANDDLVGSDSTLDLTYCYNTKPDRYIGKNQTVGYQLLETPIISSPGDTAVTFWGIKNDFKNIPCYAPRMEKNLGERGWNDIPYDENMAEYAYNRLQCLDLYGNPSIDPITNQPSKWVFSGDPISGTGWIEDIMPRDRRMMISTGPINMAPGASKALTLAIIGKQEIGPFEHIAELKQDARFLKDFFRNQFQLLVSANVDVREISERKRELLISAKVKNQVNNIQVIAKIFNYKNHILREIELYDDGCHSDELSHDYIYGNIWQTFTSDEALYLNLQIIDEFGNSFLINHAVNRITLSNKLKIKPVVIADSRNYNNEVNPGENIRITFAVKSSYSFDVLDFILSATLSDSLISLSYPTRYFYMDTLEAGHYFSFKDVLSFNIPLEISDGHEIKFELESYDTDFHHWKHSCSVPVKPFDYIPNEIIPTHVSGKSDASFFIRVIEPSELTGHSYTITVFDSLSWYYFNLIDQTTGSSLLINSRLPDYYAYNIPITDGFKVVKAIVPRNGIKEVYYKDAPGGSIAGFEGVYDGGKFTNNDVVVGLTPEQEMYSIEIEFTNDINSEGVVGIPKGQLAYGYVRGNPGLAPTILHNPFKVWKTYKDQRIGQLNVCLDEKSNMPNYDGIWAPDTSTFGGYERLFIMKTDYDSTGSFYQNKPLNMFEAMYTLYFRLKSDSSVVNAGDKFIIKWERAPTDEDMWVFTPTNVEQQKKVLPESFELFQNFPNPFNPTTTIRFLIDKPSLVSLKIYNIMGQEIAELIDENLTPGVHSVRWDGKNKVGQLVSSGLYFAKLTSNKKWQLIKMLLIQ